MLPDRIKPCVLIYIFPHSDGDKKIREVQAGMEEEGIPCSIMSSNESDEITLAYQAASASKLGVGIGIGAKNLCIHYAKLPANQPLFALNAAGTPAQWRHFGYNAARLVKGIPFKNQPSEDVGPQIIDSKALYQIVYKIVHKVLLEGAEDHGEVKAWSKTR